MPDDKPRNNNNELRFTFSGRKDKYEDDFYFCAPNVPGSVRWADVVMMFFPAADDGAEKFSGDLVIKLKRDKEELERERKRRTESKS